MPAPAALAAQPSPPVPRPKAAPESWTPVAVEYRDGRLTVSLANLPAESLLKRLLRLRFDVVWAFDRPAGGGAIRMTEVWVLPEGSAGLGVAQRGQGAEKPGITDAEAREVEW